MGSCEQMVCVSFIAGRSSELETGCGGAGRARGDGTDGWVRVLMQTTLYRAAQRLGETRRLGTALTKGPVRHASAAQAKS